MLATAVGVARGDSRGARARGEEKISRTFELLDPGLDRARGPRLPDIFQPRGGVFRVRHAGPCEIVLEHGERYFQPGKDVERDERSSRVGVGRPRHPHGPSPDRRARQGKCAARDSDRPPPKNVKKGSDRGRFDARAGEERCGAVDGRALPGGHSVISPPIVQEWRDLPRIHVLPY